MKYTEIVRHLAAQASGEWFSVEPNSSEVKSSASQKAHLLEELAVKCKSCTRCELYKTATNLVFFDGNPDAQMVLIGEAPGADEDAQGKPFVGRAGKLLTAALEECGMPRKSVYICNILKHRPPDNRNPLPNEIEACTPFLLEQLKILQPLLIITLGNFSTKFMLSLDEGITKLRGNIAKSPLGYNILPTFHPAAVLRNMNLITDLKSDIQKGLEFIKTGGK